MGRHFCGHCGQPALEDERFCVACGGALRRPGAEAAALEAVAEGPSLGPSAVLGEAVAMLSAGDAAGACLALEQLLVERPRWPVARAYLGIAYLRVTRVADAREAVEAAVAEAPDSFICHTKYAEFLARLGYYDMAVREIDIALRLPTPDAASAHAARELRQHCVEKGKGLFYRQTSSPSQFRLRNLLPARRLHVATVSTGKGG